MQRRAFILGLMASAGVSAVSSAKANENTFPYPDWFIRDLQRNASWLPDIVKQVGLDNAFLHRFELFPEDIQAKLIEWDIPRWYIALVSDTLKKQYEVNTQLRLMFSLAGKQPDNKYSQRFEQLSYFAGAAQLPSLGDINTGKNLGNEGCSASICRYLLSQMLIDFPELGALNKNLFTSQDSAAMKTMFEHDKTNFIKVRKIEYKPLKRSNFKPGSILIAVKPGGTHCMAVTRIASEWHWDPMDLMMIGNTGLVEFGDRMCLAQDYVTSDINKMTFNMKELSHNKHGPINLDTLPFFDIQASNAKCNPMERSRVGCLSDPEVNIYAAKDATFFMVDFEDPRLIVD